ncbi:putative glycosyltransferase [Lactobacillus rhamnosus GG] [Lacticaseibacillus rhamnosus]|nr:putative glycosyltransferase [Lactobacillus rhamnosus GG] [Lacticaseibacillus rhamnosus]
MCIRDSIKTYSIFLDARILLQTIKILFDKVSSQGLEEDIEPERQKLHDLVVQQDITPVSYTHLRAHETEADLVCRLLLEKKKKKKKKKKNQNTIAQTKY